MTTKRNKFVLQRSYPHQLQLRPINRGCIRIRPDSFSKVLLLNKSPSGCLRRVYYFVVCSVCVEMKFALGEFRTFPLLLVAVCAVGILVGSSEALPSSSKQSLANNSNKNKEDDSEVTAGRQVAVVAQNSNDVLKDDESNKDDVMFKIPGFRAVTKREYDNINSAIISASRSPRQLLRQATDENSSWISAIAVMIPAVLRLIFPRMDLPLPLISLFVEMAFRVLEIIII